MARARLSIALLLCTAGIAPAAAQSVAVPVVQALPPGYVPAGPVADSPEVSAPVPQPRIMVGEGGDWDEARTRLRASAATPMARAIERWNLLRDYDNLSFGDYAGFVLANPGFPEQDKFRRNAERALERETPSADRLVSFFDRQPPLTNPARAKFALALSTMGRGDAVEEAKAAWRGGPTSDADEFALATMLSGKLTREDEDVRMSALLWAGATTQAARQISRVSPERLALFGAALAAAQGNDPAALGIAIPAETASDPLWLYLKSRQLRRSGQTQAAAWLLATRPRLSSLPQDKGKWVAEQLTAARGADASTAVQIASKIDDGFGKGADISRFPFQLRDDYTSLMWLGGTRALNGLGDGRSAAPLFWRYGAAARTPQTRSKGFYWAGRALAQAGDREGAERYFEAAGQYASQFYGQLSLERLGEPMPDFPRQADATPTQAERAAFEARPITSAVREVARESDWPTAIRFFREIADQARTPGEHQLVANLARDLGRRDLGVILGQAAEADGHGDFQAISFPLIPVPQGTNWTMVHAISRQESQFAMNAVSHAGARGLMQLMPGTAREQARIIGLSYDPGALMGDAGYNLSLGGGYIARMLDYYGGSYPLAVAAYNAGPGNVNKWLRSNGDPRQGGIDWVDWIERIPLQETRNYVQRVLENAVVYEAMNPDRASYRGPNPISHFLGKRTPG